MVILSKAGLVDGRHGKGGGYKLNRTADEYTVGEILRLTENGLVPVSCLKEEHNTCERIAECRTLPMWESLNKLINDFFDDITLADLAKIEPPNDYVI